MKNIFDLVVDKVKEKELPLCVGLDPHIEFIPKFIIQDNIKKYGKSQKAICEAIFQFNKLIIDSLKKYVAVFKPQIAFYEMFGIDGVAAFKKTIDYLKENNLIVIIDGKRNDIGSTSKAYADAFLSKKNVFGIDIDNFESDLLTVNGYLGEDGLIPFIENSAKFKKGVFVLAKTSNKSAVQIQELLADNKKIYEYLVDIVVNISKQYEGKYGFTNAGIVVGATYPDTLKYLRNKYKNLFFLIPGFQSQGGDLDSLKYAFLPDKVGAVVNSSRGVIFAYKKYSMDEKDFIRASIRAVEEIYEGIKKIYKF